MLDLMHDGEPYGHLTNNGVPMTVAELARTVGESPAKVKKWLKELEDKRVLSRTAEGVIYSRRMVRDEEIRRKRAEGGAASLDNPNVPRPKSAPQGHLEGLYDEHQEGPREGYPSSETPSSENQHVFHQNSFKKESAPRTSQNGESEFKNGSDEPSEGRPSGDPSGGPLHLHSAYIHVDSLPSSNARASRISIKNGGAPHPSEGPVARVLRDDEDRQEWVSESGRHWVRVCGVADDKGQWEGGGRGDR
jgi:DNA-binding Lrp family transcriptional regulator